MILLKCLRDNFNWDVSPVFAIQPFLALLVLYIKVMFLKILCRNEENKLNEE